jgi:hypothetical protein
MNHAPPSGRSETTSIGKLLPLPARKCMSRLVLNSALERFVVRHQIIL